MRNGLDVSSARTAAFAAWLVWHIVLALHMRTEREPLLRRGLRLTLPYGVWAITATVLALAGPFIPVVRDRLYLVSLPSTAVSAVLISAVLLPSWLEMWRLVARARTTAR